MKIHWPFGLDKEPYWGLCPECEDEPVFLHCYRRNVATCPKCKTAWIVGDNLFGIPTYGAEAEAVRAELDSYRGVEPYYPPIWRLPLGWQLAFWRQRISYALWWLTPPILHRRRNRAEFLL